jgi:hypothetical protein
MNDINVGFDSSAFEEYIRRIVREEVQDEFSYQDSGEDSD